MKDKLQKTVNAVVLAKGNQAEAARQIGIARTTLISRLEAAERAGIKPTVKSPNLEVALAEQKMIYDSQIRDLKKQLEESIQQNVTSNYVRKHVLKLGKYQATPPKWVTKSSPATGNPGVPTLFLSDFHYGEIVKPDAVGNLNNFNKKISQSRLKSTVETAIDLCHNHMVNPKYPGIVLALGGDMMAGSIHDELIESNDGTNIDHVLELFDQLVWTISTLADKFGKVFVPTCYGNHSRMYQQYRNKEAAHLSFDWMLYNMLEKHYKANKDERIKFLISAGFDTYYKIYNTSYLLTHGDRLGVRGGTGIVGMLGPIARGVQKVRSEYANFGKSIDYVILGHYHQYISIKGAIVNGSLKGYDEYAMSNRFAFEIPRQALWFTHPQYGITFQVPVVAEQGVPKKPKKEWLQWAA
jgi:DNA-binding XRE family transcriptional regulator